jgi:hypothetical protein
MFLKAKSTDLFIKWIKIRWRKPRWLPRAPTKEFYVREPTPIDPVEHAELLWRYKEYRHTVDAIRFIEIYIFIVISLKGVPLITVSVNSILFKRYIIYINNIDSFINFYIFFFNMRTKQLLIWDQRCGCGKLVEFLLS